MNREDRRRFRTARPRAQLRRGRTEWYRMENKAGTAEVYLFDEIGYFGVTASDFVRDLQALDASRIEMHINSPGGEVFDGIAIYNALRDHDARVDVIVDGMAASAASFIAMAGDHVAMNRNSTMMIHDGHGLVIGNAADMRELADLLDKTSDNIASIYAERTGGDTAEWRELMRVETWFSADEAVEAGLADEVRGAKSEASNSWDLSIFKFGGRGDAPAPAVPSLSGRVATPSGDAGSPAPTTQPLDLDVDRLMREMKEALSA